MINIIEDKPTKLSGLTSLYISFDYKSEIITILKNAEKAIYDPKDYHWEAPINCLAYLINNLTYVDDIVLKLKVKNKQTEHLIPKCKYKTKPFDYQLETVEFGLNRDPEDGGFLLLDQPGLGKTLQMICLAQELKEQKGLEHCLIICGINTLKANWEKEIYKHSDLTCRIIGKRINKKGKVISAKMEDRALEILNPISEFFVIINIESLRSDEIIKAFKKSKNKFDMVVVDEVHKCGAKSQQSDGLLKLKDAKYPIGLTGTLLTNSPLSAFIPLKFIGVENATLTNFKSQYCVFGGFGGHQIVGYKNIDLLKSIIDSCSIRRTKDKLNIPPKTLIEEVVELNDTHQKFYDNVKDGIVEECDKIQLNTSSVLGLITRLRQATSCPSYLTTEKIPCTKLERAKELVDDIISQGEKVVIMCNFKESVKELYEMLKEYNPLMGSGDISDDQVSKNIDLFQEKDKYKVFIGTASKCGTGITLNAACYMICIDTPYTWALFEQIQDRIHRISNVKPVFVYELISKDTIDEVIHEIVHNKKALSDFVIDDKVDDQTVKRLENYLNHLGDKSNIVEVK